MCQGLGPKKHDEISEIDRMHAYKLQTVTHRVFTLYVCMCVQGPLLSTSVMLNCVSEMNINCVCTCCVCMCVHEASLFACV